MSADRPDHTADPEQPAEAGFAEGQADPKKYPQDEEVGSFAEGQEEVPDDDRAKGSFAEGQEELPGDDRAQGSFAEGQEGE